ncbi:MAG: (2Fe-2S) ferredoxin domain-containing protein, partial [Desulfotomaculaceae bacterium]|nr:(2Fe-2S) ferredoxin domain-containing protein [Desulfotomaculaceae bacterium]
MKVKNTEDLREIKDEFFPLIKQRMGYSNGLGITQVLVCSGTACSSAESQDFRLELERELDRRNLRDNVRVFKTGCFGFCQHGPIIMVHPGEVFYSKVRPEDVKEFVETHLISGRVVERLLYQNNGQKANNIEDINFFKAQKRIVLRNCGVIDPE